MERASLHEALAPCGTLATVAPRTGPDGRAETFAAALERVAAAAAAVGARVGNAVASASVGHHSPGDVFGKQRSVLPLTAADAARGGGGGKPCGRLGLRGALLAVYMSAVHVLLFVAMQSHAQHHD